MKLKRMTLVAAAAMVGPTLLSATPAMADDQPAVTVPDSAPKDDAAPVADPAPATKPAPETAPVVPVTPVTPVVEQPAVAAPPPVTPGPAPVAEQAGETKDAPADSELLGPDVRITGIPKDGFTPGGGWTPLTVTVDNSAHIEVKNLTPLIDIGRVGGKLKAEHYKLEYLAEDHSWKPARWLNPDEPSLVNNFSVGEPRTVARGGSYTVQVRISFTADTPVVAFDMTSAGLSIRPDGGRAWGGGNSYKAKIAGAADIPDDFVEGPGISLEGVPENTKVGGWQQLSIHIDNAGKRALGRFDVYLGVVRPDWVKTKSSDFQVEYYGTQGWERAELRYEDGYFVVNQVGGIPVAAGQSLDLKIRVRFNTNATLGDLDFYLFGDAQTGPNGSEFVSSRGAMRLTRLVAADPATGEAGNDPAPNGGATPISDTGTGTTTQTGGELAATGSSPATTWALGGAGVALAMGAALVAGTGRRRRPTA
ncbi:hypothetical protein [Streptomyces sp. NBC_00503]|uniref:hypothetical protein n=1 Tax=Streptomyces sp. NBC_00503 TaxID=2903659 RepID=UPI002E81F8FB|nr:hypothetical protein [Streptomyces sp. NBC_00503]WUD82910.1 hypothetical protein OG490_21480 [Streptomyces sp. NBC_00503]